MLSAPILVIWASVAAPSGTGGFGTVRFDPAVDLASHELAVDFLITGQTIGDFDGDDCVDLYLTSQAGSNSLLRGDCAGQFVDATAQHPELALEDEQSGGASFVDFDNDGDQDLLVLARGTDALFVNDGGLFSEEAVARGLGDLGQGESAAWGDFDADGWLDLYVVNWYYADDESDPRAEDAFYRSNGDGTFEKVNGLLDPVLMSRPGFAALWFDYDLDGDVDLYVVNDKLVGNVLWRNDGAGCGGWCFVDVSISSGAHRPAFSMGISAGDYDRDGDLDLYYSSIGEAILLRNETSQGTPTFTEVSAAAGVSPLEIGWGTAFADVDNDGWLDLQLATMGEVSLDRLYRNSGDGSFEDLSLASGFGMSRSHIGMLMFDADSDGSLDVLRGGFGSAYSWSRNESSVGSWLIVTLEGSEGVNRDGIGAVLRLLLDDGTVLVRQAVRGSSIGSGDDPRVHFGLGDAVPTELQVEWTDGSRSTIKSPSPDTRVRVRSELVFQDAFESGSVAWSGVARP